MVAWRIFRTTLSPRTGGQLSLYGAINTRAVGRGGERVISSAGSSSELFRDIELWFGSTSSRAPALCRGDREPGPVEDPTA